MNTSPTGADPTRAMIEAVRTMSEKHMSPEVTITFDDHDEDLVHLDYAVCAKNAVRVTLDLNDDDSEDLLVFLTALPIILAVTMAKVIDEAKKGLDPDIVEQIIAEVDAERGRS